MIPFAPPPFPNEKMPLAIFIAFKVCQWYNPKRTEKELYEFMRLWTDEDAVIQKACAIWAIVVQETKRQELIRFSKEQKK